MGNLMRRKAIIMSYSFIVPEILSRTGYPAIALANRAWVWLKCYSRSYDTKLVIGRGESSEAAEPLRRSTFLPFQVV